MHDPGSMWQAVGRRGVSGEGGGGGTNDQCVRVDAPGHKFLQLGMLGTQSMFIVLLSDELASFSRAEGMCIYFSRFLCVQLSKRGSQ